jgi:hypothetical protein
MALIAESEFLSNEWKLEECQNGEDSDGTLTFDTSTARTSMTGISGDVKQTQYALELGTR